MVRLRKLSSKNDDSQKSHRIRADALLVQRGFAASRDRAQAMIAAGGVSINGLVLSKSSRLLDVDAVIELSGEDIPWVSRGALKLLGGLQAFPKIDPAGKLCLDIGASTGGFTEVLLAHDAARVMAVDVGKGQLHPKLVDDRRVIVMDGVNARELSVDMVVGVPDIIVCDASFISLTKILPAALSLAPVGAHLLALIKPQFEVGKGLVGKGGVVRDADLHQKTINRIEKWLVHDMGWQHIGTVASPINGPDGNREFLLAAAKPA